MQAPNTRNEEKTKSDDDDGWEDDGSDFDDEEDNFDNEGLDNPCAYVLASQDPGFSLIEQALSPLQEPGSLSCGGLATELPRLSPNGIVDFTLAMARGDVEMDEGDVPGSMYALRVAGQANPVDLPIDANTARALAIRHGKQAHFGHGEGDVVDPSVTNAWVLNSDVEFVRKGIFDEAIQRLTRRASGLLGVPTPDLVKAELRHMVLCEQGGLFRPQDGLERAAGVFGSLLVVLPSHFAGGELVVRHGDSKHVYAFGADKKGDEESNDALKSVYFAAFRADAEHEVLPVTSGVRLVLVYALTLPKSAGPARPITGYAPPEPVVDAVVKAFEAAWASSARKKRDGLGVLSLFLEHEYTPRNKGPRALRGRDLAVFRTLVEAAKRYHAAKGAKGELGMIIGTVQATAEASEDPERVEDLHHEMMALMMAMQNQGPQIDPIQERDIAQRLGKILGKKAKARVRKEPAVSIDDMTELPLRNLEVVMSDGSTVALPSDLPDGDNEHFPDLAIELTSLINPFGKQWGELWGPHWESIGPNHAGFEPDIKHRRSVLVVYRLADEVAVLDSGCAEDLGWVELISLHRLLDSSKPPEKAASRARKTLHRVATSDAILEFCEPKLLLGLLAPFTTVLRRAGDSDASIIEEIGKVTMEARWARAVGVAATAGALQTLFGSAAARAFLTSQLTSEEIEGAAREISAWVVAPDLVARLSSEQWDRATGIRVALLTDLLLADPTTLQPRTTEITSLVKEISVRTKGALTRF
jgi:hypothetical protein